MRTFNLVLVQTAPHKLHNLCTSPLRGTALPLSQQCCLCSSIMCCFEFRIYAVVFLNGVNVVFTVYFSALSMQQFCLWSVRKAIDKVLASFAAECTKVIINLAAHCKQYKLKLGSQLAVWNMCGAQEILWTSSNTTYVRALYVKCGLEGKWSTWLRLVLYLPLAHALV